ncbi:M23 family metallopeptidase [Robertmurraya sp. DFI.2.37]|uniref:M23 family metallopeptidase n=1 Tax=Robertmurraya sp. DFI.2.37 TaxID=3031819 RepID=UPI00124408F3|nr:M23 family metallopeptidase [Robertmurraya sp. DFI.2.37]MDF1510626.1 M23 family metallopeptidase [Robertmurraya sp. DFI.2.37]
MNNRFKHLSKLASNTTRGLNKAAITTVALATLTLGVGVHAFADLAFKTVYYVYVDDQFVGTVSDKEIVENVVEAKVEKTKDDFSNQLPLAVGPKLTYVPEQVFESVSNQDDKVVAEKLEKLLSIEAVATEILIDEKVPVYVKDEAAANQVMKALKLKYVSEEEWQQAQQIMNEKESLPPLKEGETRVVDVRFSKEMTLSQNKVSPKQILSVDDAVNYLTKGTLEEKKYKVKEGDVLGQIANDHDMTLEQLIKLNPGLTEDSLLKIDQELNVTFLQPLVEVIVEKEVFQKETIPFEKEVIEDSSMYKGDTKVKQEGKDGLREVTYKVSEQNGKQTQKVVIDENILQEPMSHVAIKGTKVIPSRGDGSFAWPAVGGYISSKQGQRWGKLHKGIDIARPSDRTIKASDNGIVQSAGWSGGYGNKVVINHQNGFETVYAHLSSIDVKVGQTVSKGMKIGVMGSTGNSTGVHLHFEIYKNGNLENPLNYLK